MKLRYALCALFLLGASAAQADNSGAWSEQDVKKLCHYRSASGNNAPASFDRCMKRRTATIGKQKKPGEATELKKANKHLDKTIAARKAAEKTTEEAK